MNAKQILLLLLGSFLIAGIIMFQMRSRRTAPRPVASPAQPVAESTQPAEPAAPVPQPEATPSQASIPATGWGRNPFLSLDEISKMNQPAETPATAEAPRRPAEPPALPTYEVTAIVATNQGSWAVVDSRVVRVGDRLGQETVRQIRPETIVLEHEGKIRELSLKRLDFDIRRSVPKGE